MATQHGVPSKLPTLAYMDHRLWALLQGGFGSVAMNSGKSNGYSPSPLLLLPQAFTHCMLNLPSTLLLKALWWSKSPWHVLPLCSLCPTEKRNHEDSAALKTFCTHWSRGGRQHLAWCEVTDWKKSNAVSIALVISGDLWLYEPRLKNIWQELCPLL